jgi:hypothetical protein
LAAFRALHLPRRVKSSRAGNEYSGFTFQSDLEPDDEPFEGVEMFDPIDTIHISEGAFDHLMSRYFNAIIEGATAHQKPEIQEEWWQDFVEIARELDARVNNSGK